MARTALIVVTVTSCATALAGGAAGLVWFLRSRGKKTVTRSGSSHHWYSALKKIKLTNKNGMTVHFTPVGAAIQRLFVPDRNGVKEDIVLGYDGANTYATVSPTPYFGAVVGRVANRIKDGTFSLDGEQYKLLANNGKNALHGGALGLHKRTWQHKQRHTDTHNVVDFSYTSPTGEEGYPGELHITASYQLAKEANELRLTITATTTQATPVNIAQHSYFNLAGHAKGSVLNHVLTLPEADHYIPVDSEGIPTGVIAPVAGTPFDFTAPHVIGTRIGTVPGGYDHTWVLCRMGAAAKDKTTNGVASAKPRLAATVHHPSSGRVLNVLTTAPGIQFYSGNFLDGKGEAGKGGAAYVKNGGLCLETQGFPNAVNEPNFPSVILQPDATYLHEVVYTFSIK